ncbi:MAG: replicative DNA helicase [Bacteroidia bacterium]|nr:replicative DNA helicase [Bacteroidia bacterium]
MNERLSNRNLGKKNKQSAELITALDTMGRKVPAALDMEQAVLGALLLDGTSMLRIQEILMPEYFYDEKNQFVFNAIRSLVERNEPIDLLTVIEKLRAQEKLEFVGGEFYVSELTMKVTSSANIEFHAHIIVEKYVQRVLINICGETIRDAYEPSADAFALLDDTEKKIYEIKNKGMKRNYEGIDNLVAKALMQIEANTKHTSDVTGVPSGIASVDRITSGWQKSDLIIIAGRPGMGKTAFALTMLRNAAVGHNVPVAFFSLEMSAVQLVTRMISAEAEISSEDLRKGNLKEHQWQQIVTKTQTLSQAPIFIDDTPSLSVFELKAKARRLHSQHGIGMIMVDYLQLMKGDEVKESKMNREQEISHISRSLKTLAKELNIPVIALAQLSRETEKRTDKTPQLSDLRESGSIEQDADMVAFIYRDDYYNKTEEDMSNAVGTASKLIIKKHRNGSIGDANMFFSKRVQRFVDESESMIANYVMQSKMNQSGEEMNSFKDAISHKGNIFDTGNDSPFDGASDTEANFFDN